MRAFFNYLAGSCLWPLPIVAVLAVMCAVTYGVHKSPARYSPILSGPAPEMVAPGGLRLWRRSLSGLSFSGEGAGSEVHLAPRQGQDIAVVQTVIAVPEGADGLRIDLSIGAQGLDPGAEAWQNAKLQILSFDKTGHFLWYWPKDIIVVMADRPFGPATAILPLREGLRRVLVRIYNGADSGVLRIGPPKIFAAMERPIFTFLRGGLILAWTAVGLWAARATARRASNRLRTGILFGAAALVLIGTLTPQPAFRTAIEPLESLVLAGADSLFWQRPTSPSLPQQAASTLSAARDRAGVDSGAREVLTRGARGDQTNVVREAPVKAQPLARAAPMPARFATSERPDYPFSFKEIGHFSLFFLLAIACYAAFPRTSWSGRFVCLASFAVATETLQWFVVTRSSSVKDLAVDMAGLALATVVAAAGYWIMAAAKARTRTRASPGA